MKGDGVIVLPRAILRRRERIGPAQLIPIIDVLFDSDHLRAGDGLRLLQPREQAIRGGTTGTTFAGEQLDDDGDRPVGGHAPEARRTASAKKALE